VPYGKIEEAPAAIRELDGVALTLEQVNEIAAMADAIQQAGGAENPWAVAIGKWKQGHVIKDGKWEKKEAPPAPAAEPAKALKMADDDEWAIEGIAIPFHGPVPGDLDFDKEKFTKDTDFRMDWFPEGRPMLYHHGHDKTMGIDAVGRQATQKLTEAGVWVRAQIDRANAYANEIRELVKAGKLFFSSGALAHLVRKTNGVIKVWPWVELSLTTDPINPYAVAMPAAMKSFKAAGLRFDIPAEAEQSQGELERAPDSKADADKKTATKGWLEMEATELKGVMTEAVVAAFKAQADAAAAEKAKTEDAAKAKAAFDANVAEAVKAELSKHLEPNKLQHATGGAAEKARISVGSKYDHMDDVDLDILAWATGATKGGWTDKLRNALGERWTKSGRKAYTYVSKKEDEDGEKATSIADTADTSNWVPTLMATEVWKKMRLENKVAGLFKNFDMPHSPYDLPTESTDPVVYAVAEFTGAADPTLITGITISQFADTKVTLTANKFGSAAWFTGELEEENAFPLVPLIREQMTRKMSDAVEYIILNGDSTNDGTNVSVDTPGATGLCIVAEGLRHFALITPGSLTKDCGALTLDDLIAVRQLMGKSGVDVKNQAWICDVDTYLAALLKIDEFLTLDKLGTQAVVLSGQVGTILGAPVIVSENLDKTGVNGKLFAGGTVGSMICVARDRFIVGWRRQPRFSLYYSENNDASRISVLARMAFGAFNTTSGTDCALGYNITVS
jgi:HK97 family phage major capsid protein